MVWICIALIMSKVEHVFESLKAILLAFIDYLLVSYAIFLSGFWKNYQEEFASFWWWVFYLGTKAVFPPGSVNF